MSKLASSACLLATVFAGSVSAQSADATALESFDWRARNRAALALANADELPVAELVAVLGRTWSGPDLRMGRYGGRSGPRRPTDPWEQVWEAARRELLEPTGPATPPSPWHDVAGVSDLVVPWHPHALANWLLRTRPAAHGELATLLAERPLTTRALGELWLVSARPSTDVVLARDWRGSDLAVVARALWFDADGGPERIAPLLTRGGADLRRAIVGLGDPAVLVDDSAIDAVIDVFLDDREAQGRAASLLTRSGVAAARLRARLGEEPAANRAVLGVLCVMADEVGEIGDELLPFVTADDRVAQQRALAIIARAQVPPPTGFAMLESLLSLAEARRGSSLGLLAIDAIGSLGDAVDGAARSRLLALLEAAGAAGARARLLGCLHRLGVVPQVSWERKVEICSMRHATQHTWLVVVDDEHVPAPTLRDLLVQERANPFRKTCVERRAERLPEQVLAWLDDDDLTLRRMAIDALRRQPAGLVGSMRIAHLLADPEPSFVRDALAWLAEREDASEYAAAGLESIARAFPQWLPSEAVAFVQRAAPCLPDLTRELSPLFVDGVGLELLDAYAVEEVAAALRPWLFAAKTSDAEQSLLAWFVRNGVHDDEVAEITLRVLAQTGCSTLLWALREAPTLPEAVARALEQRIDDAFAALEPGGLDSTGGEFAREALLAQARRSAPR